MRQFQTTVLERKERITDGYATEPFECAWAGEAIFFVTAEGEPKAGASVFAHVQISADGIEWMDEGSVLSNPDTAGRSFAKVMNFGGWLRLRFEIRGAKEGIVLSVRLALKE